MMFVDRPSIIVKGPSVSSGASFASFSDSGASGLSWLATPGVGNEFATDLIGDNPRLKLADSDHPPSQDKGSK